MKVPFVFLEIKPSVHSYFVYVNITEADRMQGRVKLNTPHPQNMLHTL